MANKTKEQIAEDAKQADIEAKNAAAIKEAEAKAKHDADVEAAAYEAQRTAAVPTTETTAKADIGPTVDQAEAKAEAQTTKTMVSGITPAAGDPYWITDETGRRYNPNDVKFYVEKGHENMPEGVTIVSREVAEQFVKLGIGYIVK